MNFQQVGYAQALIDLGFQKEAGVFSNVGKRISSVFKSRAPAPALAPAPMMPATPSNVLGDPGFRYSRMPTGGQNQPVPIPAYLSGFKPKPVQQWGGRTIPAATLPTAPAAAHQATLPGISRDKMHEYFSRQARKDSESLKQSLQRGSLESDLTLDDLRSHLSGILGQAA